MKRQTFALTISFMLALSALAAAGYLPPSSAQQNATGQDGPASTTVIIPSGASISGQVEEYYQPQVEQAAGGSIVTWSNRDSTLHTATAGNPVDGPSGQFDTGMITPGGFGSARIEGEGRIPYYCTLHPFMLGVIEVTSAQAAPVGNTTANATAASGTTNATGGNATATQPASSNATSANATSTNATEGVTITPFAAQGSIASLVLPVSQNGNTSAAPDAGQNMSYVVSGNWSIDYQSINSTEFGASFDMVLTDGTNRHTHDISNFQPVSIYQQNASVLITGTSDISVDGSVQWSDVYVTVIVVDNSTLNIGINSEATDNHFRGQPLFGIVEPDQNGSGNSTSASAEPLETLQEELSDLGANASQAGREVINETRDALQ